MKDTRGMRVKTTRPKLTPSVILPGKQDRLRQMILYVATKCAKAERMGLIKLNKILWKADFDAFAARQRPITGREYQRLDLGPRGHAGAVARQRKLAHAPRLFSARAWCEENPV